MSAPAPPEDLRRALESAGAEISESRRIDYAVQHRVSRGADKAIINLYDSGKALVQGKDSPLKELIEQWKERRGYSGNANGKSTASCEQRQGAPASDATPRLGTDEAGKGDYFGPLVVAGVRVSGKEADEALRGIGVRDSKLLSTSQATAMARQIEETLGSENLCVLCLAPEEFERRRAAANNNVNRLLGELNVEILDALGGGVKRFVVDEFARKARSYIQPCVPEGVALEVRPRAEDDAAVAAASILARARYLREMQELSEWAGLTLPRGATHVKEAAEALLAERGHEGLRRAAKVSFATTGKLDGGGA